MGAAFGEEAVETDGAEDQHSDDGVLPELRDAEDRQRRVDGDQQERADGSAVHRPAATEDRDAADDHGRDRLELQTLAGGRGGGRVPRGLHDTGQARERPTQDERAEDTSAY